MPVSGFAPATLGALRATLAAVSCLGVATACGGDVVGATSRQPAVASVAISSLPSLLRVGDSLFAIATLKDAAGNVLTGRIVTWSSSDPTVVRVNDAGKISAIAPGSAAITATSESVSGAAAVSVYAPTVGSLALTPSADTLFPADVVTLVLTAHDAGGRLIVNPSGVGWASSNSTVAVVSSSGVVTAVSLGATVISATVGGVSAKAVITVIPMLAPEAIDGDWTMTLSASPSCREKLPDIARERHYLVHFIQHGSVFDYSIDSPTLAISGTANQHGRLIGTSINFIFGGDTDYGSWASTYLHDHLSNTETLDFWGGVAGIVADSVINATMGGDLGYWNGPFTFSGPAVVCRAADHVVTLRRGTATGT